jgi:hypothetical protein
MDPRRSGSGGLPGGRPPALRSLSNQLKEVFLHNSTEAVALIAAALNDADRSIIGDPRRGSYAVSLVTNDIDEARQLEAHLASFGFEARTNVRRDEHGQPRLAYVTLYDAADQRRLFDVLEGHLEPNRHQRFEDLVLARGPIPDDILQRIWRASETFAWTAERIAQEMNKLRIIAGMGGIHWTAKKVRAALDEYERRAAEHEAA